MITTPSDAARSPFPHLRRERSRTATLRWGRALPSVARLLADRRADVALPACPLLRAGDNYEHTFSDAVAYWTALDHLLRYQLGWTHPAQGLSRWLDEGAPDKLRPLALVRYVWLGDGYLQRYLGWRLEKTNDHLSSAWTTRLAALEHTWGEEGQPIGPWQLHLEDPGMHALSPEQGEPPKLALLEPFGSLVGPANSPLLGQAEPVVLFRGSLEDGWYGALNLAPTPAVRVISERHGLIGVYTRSPSTRRWHTVTEEIHSWGHRPS